jgi:type II secretory pathway pseudopilin PulG
MLTRILAGVALVLGIAAGGLGWLAHGQIERNARLVAEKQQIEDALEASQELRRADQATLASLARQKAAQARSDAKRRASVEAALAPNAAWAATPVPKEVQDALRNP